MVNIKKFWFLYVVVVLSVISTGFSISFEELLNSYDFLYTTNDVTNLTVTKQEIDIDDNSKYDFLSLKLDFENLYGDYKLVGKLYDNEKLRIIHTYENYFYSGQSSMNFNFSSQFLDKERYTLQLQIYKNNQLVYRDYNVMTFNINLSQYEQNQIKLEYLNYSINNIDDDVNMLNVNYNIQNLQIANYTFASVIRNGKYNFIKQQNITSSNNLNLSFQFNISNLIADNKLLINLTYVSISNNTDMYFIYLKKQINNTILQSNLKTSYFTETYLCIPIDENNNSLYEELQLSLQAQINKVGEYKIHLLLKNEYDEIILQTYNIEINKTGLMFLPLVIQGSDIYKKQLNGPYKLMASIYYDNKLKNSIQYEVETEEYSFTDFEILNMPDLTFGNFSVQNNTLKIIVGNVGNVDAFGVTLIIYNESYNKIFETLIPYILLNKTLTYNIDNVNENKKYIGILDWYNTIDEKDENNNLIFYPVINKSMEPTLKNISMETNILSNNLIAYYSFDENTNDISGNEYNDFVNGANLTYGILGNSYYFDGINDYITYPSNIVNTLPITVSIWINGYNYENKIEEIPKNSSFNQNELWNITRFFKTEFIAPVWVSQQAIKYKTSNTIDKNWTDLITNQCLNNASWEHIVLIWDNLSKKIYVNGILDNWAKVWRLNFVDDNLYLGCNKKNKYCFKGMIDEVGFWNRTLSDLEIKILYNEGQGLQYPFDVQNTTYDTYENSTINETN